MIVPYLQRFRARARTLAVAASLVLASSALAQPSPPTTLAQQRDAFRAAYAAAQDGGDWRALSQGLEAYPLYPYLEAAALQHDIRTASAARVDAYLQSHGDMIPAVDLRKAELGWLAQQQDWKGFLHFYQPGFGDALACDALQAKVAQGGKLDFEGDLASLW
ncbi:MAG: lytic murein transglycosylase, partial [Xanthomonadaceae bacterium]|nr:lytic murein transglycosylase [Xanthomonadaceae bacterium]